MYCDAGLNTEHIIYLNVYQNLVLTAMKMHRYIRTWGINTTKNSAFIESGLWESLLCSEAHDAFFRVYPADNLAHVYKHPKQGLQSCREGVCRSLRDSKDPR